MTRLAIVVALSMLGACSGTWGAEHRPTIRVANAATAGAAAVTMALDWCGTRHAAATRRDAWEEGMPTRQLIGSSPRVGQVDAYFAVATLILAAGAQLVPERYRWVAYAAVTAVEADTTYGNLATTRCGPIGSGS